MAFLFILQMTLSLYFSMIFTHIQLKKKKKIAQLAQLAQQSQNDDVSEKTRNFTDIEQNLFSSGFQPSVAFSAWKSGKQKKIRVSAAAEKVSSSSSSSSS
jgi:DNA-binding protein H-NS